MKPVFLSYRRTDSSAITGRLADHLVSRFGAPNVFRDMDSIPPGADFRSSIRSAVHSCGAMVAVIGESWLDPRLHDPNDWVRIELESALERDIPVIPALLGETPLP